MKAAVVNVPVIALMLGIAVHIGPSNASATSDSQVRWDEASRRVELRVSQGAPWMTDGLARIVLVDGSALVTDDARFEAVQRGEDGAAILEFIDRRGMADLRWTIRPLDEHSATAQLEIVNRGEKPLKLDRLEVLVGRFRQRHDSSKPHVLLNGFVLSEPHPTTREAAKTSLKSRETAAIESPPAAAGWLTGKHNFGHVDFEDLNGRPVIVAWGECNGCELPAGTSRTSDLFFLSTHPRPLEQMERFATLAGKLNGAKIWPPRVAWCTWYAGWMRERMADHEGGMERGIERMIPVIKSHFASRGAKTMRICDDFLDYGDWSNNTKTVPRGFDRLARLIDAAGLTPGVWYAPYWAEAESKVLRDHPEWFARDKKGEVWFETGWQPNSRDTTKFAVFDTTRPEVVGYFEETARTWRERGFRYVSTDFLLWSLKPDRYDDPTKTKAEVLRAGMEAIRRGLGPEVFYRPINNPLGVAMGIADDTRISGDSHGDNPTAYFRTAEVWFYNRRLWLNDPESIVCARYGQLRDLEWNKMWMSWIALAGTAMTYGEVLDKLPKQYVEMYKRLFPPLPVAGRPLDLWENDPYLLWGIVPDEADGPYVLFGLFDLDGKGPRQVRLNLDEIAARARGWQKPATAPRDYVLWDFWQGKLLRSNGPLLDLPMPSRGGRLFALRPRLGRPQLLGTSGHFSQGALETSEIRWDRATATLSGKVQGNGGDPTTLFFSLPEGITLAEATLSGRPIATDAPEASVVALCVPPTGRPLLFALRFEGKTVESVETRPFVSGRAATR